MKKRFDISDYVGCMIFGIFLTTILLILATVFLGIPWIVGIIEQLVDKL